MISRQTDQEELRFYRAAGLRLAAAFAVFLLLWCLVAFAEPGRKLVWDPLPDPFIAYKVYGTTNILRTNVSDIFDPIALELDQFIVIGQSTNVIEKTGGWALIGWTSNNFFPVQTTGTFRFFRVRAFNTATGLESE